MNQRTIKMNSNQVNWLIDIAAFTFFFLISAPQSTGIPLHEWLSFVFFGTFIVHILTHWEWITSVPKRLFKKLSGETRFNYVLNFFFYFSIIITMLSGILISQAVLPALGIEAKNDPFWRSLHNLFSNLSLLVLAVHLAVHWNWIVNAFKRYVLRKTTTH
ncbi:MAG: DUF4405 domain-containing protein [Chloroflexota bacterium]